MSNTQSPITVRPGQVMVIVGRTYQGSVVIDRGELVSVHDTDAQAERGALAIRHLGGLYARADICIAGQDRTPRGAVLAGV